MIPKKIHYIWLSNEKLNINAKMCIRSWTKHAPEYEIKRWSMSDFNISEMPAFVKEAIRCGKWAFACDYLRLYVLEKEGGIYLDSDVFMLSKPDEFLNNQFFSFIEYIDSNYKYGKRFVDSDGNASKDMVEGMAIQAAAMGSIPHHKYIKECMRYYENSHFIVEDCGQSDYLLASHIFALIARGFGFKYINKEQELEEGVHIYPSELLATCGSGYVDNTRMIHLCCGSWRNIGIVEKLRFSIFNQLRVVMLKKLKIY